MSNAMTEEQAINDMLSARARAIGDRNAKAALSYLTDTAVHFSLAPPLAVTGKDEASFTSWLATWQGQIGGEVRNEALTIGGDVAFWTGLVHMTGTKTDGTKVDLWFRQTLGLVKQGGLWKVAHEHESVPFAMDGSGRALFDLKP
jgi:ketosteroid isomerase-like protein